VAVAIVIACLFSSCFGVLRQKLPYWTSRIIWGDILHLLYIGSAKDFIASVIKLFLLCGFFEGSNWELKLESAYASFFKWCKQHGFRPSIWKIDVKQPLGYPEINGKAFDVKLMIGWTASLALQYTGEHHVVLQTATFCLARPAVCFALCL
jgi:hypothetical protein